METDYIRIKTLLILIITIAFIEGASIFLFSDSPLNPMVIIGTARIIETLIITIALMTLEKGLSSIGLEISTIQEGLKKGLLWSIIFGLITGFIFFILHFAGMNPVALISTRLPENINEVLLFLIVGCIIGPVAEEFFFRGIIYGFLRKWGITVALVLTTVIFIFAHHNTGQIPLTQALGGIVFAIAYEIEDNLVVPIIIHILGNTAIFILPLIF